MSAQTKLLPAGGEPDYRFTLANERTFLAWIRIALALLGGGLALHQFGTRIEPSWLRLTLSGGLVVTAGLLSIGAFFQWARYQQAMRLDQPLPRGPFIIGLAAAMVILALATMIAVLWR
jgi:putative membrane protein